MTTEEADRVMAAFRQGRSHAYGEYAAGVRRTLFFDPASASFAVREQDAYSGQESTWTVTAEEMRDTLVRGFRLDQIL